MIAEELIEKLTPFIGKSYKIRLEPLEGNSTWWLTRVEDCTYGDGSHCIKLSNPPSCPHCNEVL